MALSELIQHLKPGPENKYPQPSSPFELKRLVLEHEPELKCNCDVCDPPTFYQSWRNCLLPHSHIKLKVDSAPNRFGNECYQQLKMWKMPFRGCESMHLARQTISYFDRDEESLNNTQGDALASMNTWIQTRTADFMTIDQATDLDKLIPAEEMRQLLTWINLLFCDDPSRLKFHWLKEMPSWPDAISISNSHLENYIAMKPTYPSQPRKRYMLETISALLHEAVHAHFQLCGCSDCSIRAPNHQPHGHGRPWQLLAARVENAFVRWTGLPVELSRFDSIAVHWKDFQLLPSAHDFDEWDLERETIMAFGMSAMRRAYEECGEEEKKAFSIKDFGKKWWADLPSAKIVRSNGHVAH
jgi:hypothetical protein